MAVFISLSHPVWVRGLKHSGGRGLFEIQQVAPRVGAWIETYVICVSIMTIVSHPVWVRGLKLIREALKCAQRASHPVWVRGLKLCIRNGPKMPPPSHPVWVRGLKLRQWQSECLNASSG